MKMNLEIASDHFGKLLFMKEVGSQWRVYWLPHSEKVIFYL